MHVPAAEWIGIASAAFTVVGVMLALVQVRRVGTKARAATDAAAQTRRETAGAWLQLRTPELEALELRIRRYASAGNRDGAASALREWRRIAPEYQALLQSVGARDEELDRNLELSLGLVDMALEELNDAEVSTTDACRRILRYIGEICVHSRRVAIGMMMPGHHD